MVYSNFNILFLLLVLSSPALAQVASNVPYAFSPVEYSSLVLAPPESPTPISAAMIYPQFMGNITFGPPPIQLAAGLDFTCVAYPLGIVRCAGDNAYGELGHNNQAQTSSSVPVQVAGLKRVSFLAETKFEHNCVFDDSNNIRTPWCWGLDNFGQLGDGGGKLAAYSPVKMDFPHFPVQAAAGSYHSCVVTNGSTVWCVGTNDNGELGNGNFGGWAKGFLFLGIPQLTFTQTQQDMNHVFDHAVQVSAGESHTCALRSDGTVWCWGSNSSRELGGTFDPASRAYPIQVTDEHNPLNKMSNVYSISSGWSHTCALKKDGTVACWGDNSACQAGNPLLDCNKDLMNTWAPPLTVKGLNNVLKISSGAQHTCAIKVDRTVWCWGSDESGELGDGTHGIDDRSSVVLQVQKISDDPKNQVVDIVSGANHTCALKQDGSLWCWGSNSKGQLGIGANAPKQDYLVPTLSLF